MAMPPDTKQSATRAASALKSGRVPGCGYVFDVNLEFDDVGMAKNDSDVATYMGIDFGLGEMKM